MKTNGKLLTKCRWIKIAMAFVFVLGITFRVAAQGDTFYFVPATGSANVLSNWNTKPNGSGSSPSTIYATNRIYVINNGRSAELTGSFGGEGNVISIGDETGGSLGSGTSGTLTTYAGNVFFRAKINVNNNATLNYRMTAGATYYPVLNYCAPTSTVVYSGSSSQQMLLAKYGSLTINASAGVNLSGKISIANALTLSAGLINASSASSAIVFNGLAAQILPGNAAYLNGSVNRIVVNNNAGVTLANNDVLTVTDSLIVNSGKLTLGTGSSLTIKGKSYIPAVPKADPTYKAGYSLVWNDEFDGPANSFPNPQYWVQHYTDTVPKPFTTWGQTFSSAYLKHYNYLDGQGNYISKVKDSAGVYYSGGCIATAWPYQVMKQYGYLESKVMFTANRGVNCTFWLQSPVVGANPAADDPATFGAEIDICEYLGPDTSDPFGRVNTTIHKNGYSDQYHQQLGNTSAPTVNNTGWHIVALEWTPTSYKFYTDGVLTWTLTDPAWISKHQSMILLGALVGWTPPNRPGNTWPVYMKVDYVRVYNKN